MTVTTATRTHSEWEQLHLPCPSCPSSDAYCIAKDGHGYCFSCEYYKPADKTEFRDESVSYEYLPWRGCTAESFRFFDCKTKVDNEGKPVELGYLYPNGSYKIRVLDKKAFYSKGEINKAGLFGRNKFAAGSNKTLIITEGELDAISVWQVLRTPVVSVHSSSSARVDCSVDRSWCNSFERIVLAFDSDEAGRQGAAQVASLFDYNKIYQVSFPGGNRKDANDYVRAGESDELASLIKNARRYNPEWIVSDLPAFKKIIDEQPVEGVPYPFPTLNYMTYGIRPGESVLLTAQEGVGKTEVMHSILHQLLTETDDAVGAIFLEEPKKRLLQALAGISLKKPAHLPDSGVTAGETFAAVQDLVGDDDRLHLYSHFGSDDPDTILDTIRFLVAGRGCRYILLDHVTLVVSGLGGNDERQALDYLSTRLEMLVKELNFALILVSHVNDDGLTRGSRNISKVADIRIDLSRDIKAIDPVIRSTIYVMVSKNRFCGRTGPAGELMFDPVTYTLSEFIGRPDNENYPSRDQKVVA